MRIEATSGTKINIMIAIRRWIAHQTEVSLGLQPLSLKNTTFTCDRVFYDLSYVMQYARRVTKQTSNQMIVKGNKRPNK